MSTPTGSSSAAVPFGRSCGRFSALREQDLTVYLGTNPVDGASGLALLHAAFPYIELATSEPDFARSSTDRRHGP